MSDERHPYADHPVTLVLADHVAITTARGAGGDRKVRCTCDAWTGRDYDHAAHQTEALHQAGLLADGPPPVTLTERILAERADRGRTT